jgi:CheY-like chemotaxis protein
MCCSVLVVTTNAADRVRYHNAFTDAGCSVTSAESFADARRQVNASVPDVLVAALRLGDFNGLHLAIVTRMAKGKATTVVLGDAESDSEPDVVATGSHYLLRPSVAELTGLVFRLRNAEAEPRRSRRIPVLGWVPVLVDSTVGRLLNVSNEGLAVELSGPHAYPIAATMYVSLAPDLLDVAAARSWTRPTTQGTVCGLRLAGESAREESDWYDWVAQFRQSARA